MAELKICVIESPSADDFLEKRNEGEMLCRFFHLAGIQSEHKIVVNRPSLEKALNPALYKKSFEEGYLPIIHLSAHGM